MEKHAPRSNGREKQREHNKIVTQKEIGERTAEIGDLVVVVEDNRHDKEDCRLARIAQSTKESYYVEYLTGPEKGEVKWLMPIKVSNHPLERMATDKSANSKLLSQINITDAVGISGTLKGFKGRFALAFLDNEDTVPSLVELTGVDTNSKYTMNVNVILSSNPERTYLHPLNISTSSVLANPQYTRLEPREIPTVINTNDLRDHNVMIGDILALIDDKLKEYSVARVCQKVKEHDGRISYQARYLTGKQRGDVRPLTPIMTTSTPLEKLDKKGMGDTKLLSKQQIEGAIKSGDYGNIIGRLALAYLDKEHKHPSLVSIMLAGNGKMADNLKVHVIVSPNSENKQPHFVKLDTDSLLENPKYTELGE